MKIIQRWFRSGMDETDMDEITTMNTPKTCVEVKNAYKSYPGKGIVLKSLNLCVKEGTICSLLGPSGCGKTTLLSALVGRTRLDSGQITMNVAYRSEIGYMPQELSLYQEFSIKEHMMYYGFLHSMDRDNITQRMIELIDFLELPDVESIIAHLSGGQQRRVSLSIALLHNPKLLILDEPTVGVDVILCRSIWDKLVRMSREGKTIIITTHYIEEAKRSDMIAFLRNGVMLAKDEPDRLLEIHNCDTLEGVFLKLCKQDMDRNDCNYDEMKTANLVKSKQECHLKSDDFFNWNRMVAYMLKNFFWMKRNTPMMLFTLGLPILQCTLISLAVGEDPKGLSLGIINDEMPRQMWLGCYDHPVIGCTENFRLSCLYINILKKKPIIIKEYTEVDLALKAAKQNKLWGVVHFNKNYTKAIVQRFTKRNEINDETINDSEVNVWLDMSNYVIGSVMKKYLTKTTIEFTKAISNRCNFSKGNDNIALKMEAPVFGSRVASFRQFMTPANAVLFEFFLPMMFTLGALLMEKNSGLLERSLAAGLSLLEVGLGHFVLQFLIIIIQTVLMMFVLFDVFDNPIYGSRIACLSLLLLIGICGMFYGFLIAAVCTSFTIAGCLGIGSYFPLFMLSGAIWPLEGMHYILRYMSLILPITTSVECFRALSIRSWPITNPVVYGSILSLIAWIIIFASLTIVALRYKSFA
ncbi:ABC transporter G family member 23-like [Cimex lectularius]|uniref:ABC Transporter n=1 Tax=Cimex lectularius TaxID=79782 RepID=A0A8I6RIA2_CIMLE|nr:ABC transporter G family member 23-like [Cimex lectularius]